MTFAKRAHEFLDLWSEKIPLSPEEHDALTRVLEDAYEKGVRDGAHKFNGCHGDMPEDDLYESIIAEVLKSEGITP